MNRKPTSLKKNLDRKIYIYFFSLQVSTVSAPLLGVTVSGGICINICHFITSGTMLRNFQQPGPGLSLRGGGPGISPGY